MEQKICIDTDILLDYLRKESTATEFILQHDATNLLATTHINLFELYFGAFQSLKATKNSRIVDKLGTRFTILDFDQSAARTAGLVQASLKRQGVMLNFRDLLIGACALSHGFALKTRNRRHFSRIKGLRLI